MGFFDGANNIPAANGGNRLRPGKYPALRVLKTGINQGHFGTRFVAEFEVVGEPSISEPGTAPTPVGATGSWTADISGQYGKMAVADVKAFLGACRGLTIEQTNAAKDMESFMNDCAGPNSPAVGMIVATEAFSKTTKSGQKMTKHIWIVASGAPAAAPPPPAPAPAPASEAWYAFPKADPRHLTHEYNARGETRPKT